MYCKTKVAWTSKYGLGEITVTVRRAFGVLSVSGSEQTTGKAAPLSPRRMPHCGKD